MAMETQNWEPTAPLAQRVADWLLIAAASQGSAGFTRLLLDAAELNGEADPELLRSLREDWPTN